VIKNDKWIVEQAKLGMIDPFESSLVRQVEDRPVISYGLSSYGYDLRLSPTADFRVLDIPGTVVNPKRFNPATWSLFLQTDEDGSFFIIPANSYALGLGGAIADSP